MRVDVFHTLVNPGRRRPWIELVEVTRAKAVLAEQYDFGAIWFGEHHFDVEGSDQCPNPVVLAADVAARTERLRVGMAAVTLPLWHPIRLAEDLAMVDQLSGGRLEVAFSRGILPKEIVTLNPKADRRDAEQSRAIFAEHLEIVRKAWTEDPFSWQSDRYQLPPRGLVQRGVGSENPYVDGAGELISLGVVPHPLQAPTPPLFSVTESREGVLSAARDDLGVITWYPSGGVLSSLLEEYRDEVGRTTGEAPALGERCALLRICCVAPTDAEARAIAEPAVERLFALIKRVRGIGVWLDAGEDPGDPRWESVAPFDLLLERDHLLVGSPESVAERMRRMNERHGIGHWLLQMGSAGVADEHVMQTLRLFGERVLPQLR